MTEINSHTDINQLLSLYSRSVMSNSFVTPWTIAEQAPLSMGFLRQEVSELPFPSPGDLPHPGIELAFPVSPALQADSLPAEPPGKSYNNFL